LIYDINIPVFENIKEIVSRIEKAHCLEGPPTDEELEEHLYDVIPESLKSHVVSYRLSGNVLTIYVSDPVSRQELSLRAPEMCRLLNARLGRNALGRIKGRTKR
jgi:hypothetical protein